MDGVVFIEEVISFTVFGAILLAAITIVLFAMLAGGLRLFSEGNCNEEYEKKFGGFILCIVSLILTMVFLTCYKSDNFMPYCKKMGLAENTGIYKVTVTDKADMNEFQERYEIIGYENGIYTIKEKE